MKPDYPRDEFERRTHGPGPCDAGAVGEAGSPRESGFPGLPREEDGGGADALEIAGDEHGRDEALKFEADAGKGG